MQLKPLLLFVFIFPLLIVHAQSDSTKTELYDSVFKWKISIPAGFKRLTPDEWAVIQNRGAQAIEDTYGAKIENNTKVIFVFTYNQFNYFEANYQPYDTAENGSYLESFRIVGDMVYETLKGQMVNAASFDSSYSTEIIDDLLFQKFLIQAQVGQVNMQMFLYSRLFGEKDFTVSILYIEKEKGDMILQSFRNSKFKKK